MLSDIASLFLDRPVHNGGEIGWRLWGRVVDDGGRLAWQRCGGGTSSAGVYQPTRADAPLPTWRP